jgi:protocatechuate 3,4-dioxygenase beta subunit
MKQSLVFAVCSLLFWSCGCAQDKSANDRKVGSRCEDCEAIYESPVAFEKLPNMVWLSDWEQKGQGRKLAVNGTVFHPDGSRAANIVIYIYHTDSTGVYPTRGDEKGMAKKHGYLRGWMKTNEQGEYKFFTLRPGSYPSSRNPAHIHAIIKEPGKSEYWIDDYLFDDDPFLTADERSKYQNRGGNGILKIKDVGNMLKAERNIYLGRNVPGY